MRPAGPAPTITWTKRLSQPRPQTGYISRATTYRYHSLCWRIPALVATPCLCRGGGEGGARCASSVGILAAMRTTCLRPRRCVDCLGDGRCALRSGESSNRREGEWGEGVARRSAGLGAMRRAAGGVGQFMTSRIPGKQQQLARRFLRLPSGCGFRPACREDPATRHAHREIGSGASQRPCGTWGRVRVVLGPLDHRSHVWEPCVGAMCGGSGRGRLILRVAVIILAGQPWSRVRHLNSGMGDGPGFRRVG